jgi:hypothetical protein
MEKNCSSCADCGIYADPGTECRMVNNPISKVFSLIFNSDRAACLRRIRKIGRENFAREMTDLGRPSLPRRKVKEIS